MKEADPDIVEALRESGRLFRAEDYEHSYPHCWRCETPLLYYAKSSWYVRTTEVKDELLASNEAVTLAPRAHQARALRQLAREQRGLGPLARALLGHAAAHLALGGRRGHDLRGLARGAARAGRRGARTTCTARSWTTATFERDGKTFRRVPDLIDVWWDSGCMPFAQWHAPFENQERFEERFPADYICEGLDQTRGWFYSLLAVSTLLFGRASFETVLCLGLILDAEGQKMSKSKGNAVAPWDVLDAHGADAFRWYYFTSKQPWDGYRFSLETVGESVRQFIKTLWNTYGFFVLYANVNDVEPAALDAGRADRHSTAGPCPGCRPPPRWRSSAWTTTTPPPPAARWPPSWTTSRTGTCAARAGVSGTATPRPSPRCATACWRWASWSRR